MGLLGNSLPPGLAGFVQQRQLAGQDDMRQMSQAQGLLGMQQAMTQQNQMQKDMELRGLLGQKLQAGDQEGAKQILMQMKPELFASSLVPKPQEAYTLAPGAMRFGPDNKPIASAPVTPKEPAKPQIVQLMEQAGIDPRSPEGMQMLRGALNKSTTHAPAANVRTTVTLPGDNKYIETRRADQAKGFGELEKSAQSAYNQFSTLDRFIQASEKGFAGGAAPILAGTANLMSSFGINIAPERLKDTRIMEQAIGDILGNKMAELGARGLTDKDMEILRQNLPRVEIDKTSRVAVANVLKKSAASTLAEYENARNEEAKNFPELAGRSATPAWFKDYQKNTQRYGNAPAGPQPGTIKDGYRFKGGNPADKNNWEKVNG